VGSAGQDWERECEAKEGSFQNSVDVSIMSLLPVISQIRTFLKVYGAERCLLLKKNNIYHHHLWQPRVGFEYTFPLAPPFPPRPLPSLLMFPLPVSLCLSDTPEGHVSSVEVQ